MAPSPTDPNDSERVLFLVGCILSANEKLRVDFNKLASQFNTTPGAANKRYTRLVAKAKKNPIFAGGTTNDHEEAPSTPLPSSASNEKKTPKKGGRAEATPKKAAGGTRGKKRKVDEKEGKLEQESEKEGEENGDKENVGVE